MNTLLISILFYACYGILPLKGLSAAISMPSEIIWNSKSHIVLNSYGFNAQKKSSFLFNGTEEFTDRGLTVVHFKSPVDFEFKTFDTYGSEKEAKEFVAILLKIQKNNSIFSILAHDSAAGSLSPFSETLTKMGFPVLGALKNRQAYIMHNFSGNIVEKMNDLSLNETLRLPEPLTDATEYFPKIRYKFEPSIDRYIAHAGGEVDGIKSTNSLEALNQNYKRGFRLFELDILETSDGQLVAAHDWKMWARFTDYKGELPVSHSEFKKHKIYGTYTTLDMNGINKWFAAHPDAILFTDKVNDPIAFANAFVDKSRLVMELFSLMAVEEASQNQVNAMISQDPLMKIKGDKLGYLAVNKVKHVALSRRIIQKETDLLLQLRANNIKVYVYNVNFDPGKDEKYVLENEIGLVYGMYADKWVFDPLPTGTSK